MALRFSRSPAENMSLSMLPLLYLVNTGVMMKRERERDLQREAHFETVDELFPGFKEHS